MNDDDLRHKATGMNAIVSFVGHNARLAKDLEPKETTVNHQHAVAVVLPSNGRLSDSVSTDARAVTARPAKRIDQDDGFGAGILD